jgi:glycine cleavage system H protein
LQIENCEFPDGLLYDLDNNVWVRADESNTVTIGITSVHAALAGRLKKIKFKPLDLVLQNCQSVATIESVKYFGAVRTPLSGKLVEQNARILANPKLANDSPYDEGWFARIESTKPLEEMKRLSSVNSLEETIRSQIHQLRVRCFKAYPDYEMWEIGVECAAVLVRLNELIERCALNEVVHVVSDDPTADIEMVRWADETGQAILESRSEGKLTHFIVKKVK